MRYLHADLDLDQPRPELTPEEMRAGPTNTSEKQSNT